jgi:hypothetical protein
MMSDDAPLPELPPSLLIEFDPPIEWSAGNVDAIELREPTIAEYMKAQKEIRPNATVDQYTAFQITLIAAVSGKPRQVIEKMPVRKVAEAFKYLEGFTNPGPMDTVT